MIPAAAKPRPRSGPEGTQPAPVAARFSVDLLSEAVAVGLLLALLAVVTAYLVRPLGNYDTWFHLRLGEEFWSGGSLAHPGALSTFATSPWVPTQWSTEMLASKVAGAFGLPGVAFLFGALALCFVVALYVCCRREAAILPATLATFLATVGSVYAISARPQIVSLVMLAVTVAAWLQTSRDLKARWWLVPLTWVWATAHGLWSFGVLVGLVCAVGVVADWRRELDGPTQARLLGLPLLCLAAAAVTPVGPRLLLSQLAVAGRTSLITEWGPTSFHRVPAIVVAAMIAAVVVLWVRRGEASWTRLLLLLLAGGATAYYTRLVPVGAILVAPLLASALGRSMTLRPGRLQGKGEAVVVAVAVGACLLGLGLALPGTASRPANVPAAFTARLEALPPGTTVYNSDLVGGWLEWRFPKLNPVVDGMFDAYPVAYLRRWQQAQGLAPGWRRFVTQTQARVAVLAAGSPMANALRLDLGWQKVRTDAGWVYLVAPRG